MSGVNILVVDDSFIVRKILRYYLENAGHLVEEAQDGGSAWMLAQHQQYGLIITEINISSMDGVELIEKLRQESCNRYTPILAISSERRSHKKDRASKAGASDWICKPFIEETVLNAVEKLIA